MSAIATLGSSLFGRISRSTMWLSIVLEPPKPSKKGVTVQMPSEGARCCCERFCCIDEAMQAGCVTNGTLTKAKFKRAAPRTEHGCGVTADVPRVPTSGAHTVVACGSSGRPLCANGRCIIHRGQECVDHWRYETQAFLGKYRGGDSVDGCACRTNRHTRHVESNGGTEPGDAK